MAKRFFDTEKFSDEWYRRLPLKYKIFWDYLLCKCDHAGIVKIDLDLASYFIGEKLEDDCIQKYFSERLVHLKAFKYFIPKFIYFQYGALGESNPHKAVIKRLKEEGISLSSIELANPCLTLSQPLPNPTDTLKDQDKVKVKVKDNIINTELVITNPSGIRTASEKTAKELTTIKGDARPDKVIQAYNDILAGEGKLRHCVGLGPESLKELLNSFSQLPNTQAWVELFNLVKTNPKLTGKEKTVFLATMDWLAKLDNALKVLSGKYDIPSDAEFKEKSNDDYIKSIKLG